MAGTKQGEARFTRQAIFERLVEPEGGVALWYRLKVRGPSLLLETMRKQSSALISEWGVGMARPTLLSPPLLIPNPASVCRDLINHYWPWWNGSPPSRVSFLPWIPATFVFLFASPLSLNGRVLEVKLSILHMSLVGPFLWGWLVVNTQESYFSVSL